MMNKKADWFENIMFIIMLSSTFLFVFFVLGIGFNDYKNEILKFQKKIGGMLA